MAEIPGFLQKYFSSNNLMVIYPEQFEGDGLNTPTFVDPMSTDISSTPSAIYVRLRYFVRTITNFLRKLKGEKSRHKSRIDF